MKKIILVLFLIVISFSCKREKLQPNMNFLIGSWERIDDKPGKKTYEKWFLTMDGEYKGEGYTMQQTDTIFIENMVIKFDNTKSKSAKNSWIFEVTGVNEEPTIFKINDYSDDSFTAVNLTNEFPTHIRYEIKNDTLNASVSNNEFNVDFKFVRNKH